MPKSKYEGMFAPGYTFPGTEWTVVNGNIIDYSKGTPGILVKCKCGVEKKQYVLRLIDIPITNTKKMCKRCADRGEELSIGMTYGKLTITSYPEYKRNNIDGYYCAWYYCLCECGKNKQILGARLTNGGSKSCGHCKTIENISGTYWINRKRNAKARNLEFTITQYDVILLYNAQNKLCALSGVPIEFSKCTRRKYSTYHEQTASIDRIDSSKGYTLDNIQLVHKDINQMKMDKSDDELINLCRKVVNTANKKKRNKCNIVKSQ